ncbi:hypothetical protein ACFQZJ_13455 [Maribacter chungangensis]|uniref:Exosortase-associated EpsI family protein n=1 Tax=Maribacter chungangensis TaxID=1069117 RepID=A0ABW3B5I6_9FLAO
MKYIPSKEQYKKWSLPSKMSYIGTVVGVISLVLSISILILTAILKQTVDNEILDKKWNPDKADDVVIQLLKSYGNNKEYGYTHVNSIGSLKHYILDYYVVNYDDDESIVGIGYTIPENWDCHVCRPKLSVFEFMKSENGWFLKESYINAIDAGSWGAPPSKIDVLPIGFKIFGVVIHSGDLNMGYSTEYASIYSFIKDDIKEILTTQTFSSNWGTGNVFEKKTVKIKIIKEGANYYDLSLIKIDSLDSEEIANEISRYQFNGLKYVPVSSIE